MGNREGGATETKQCVKVKVHVTQRRNLPFISLF